MLLKFQNDTQVSFTKSLTQNKTKVISQLDNGSTRFIDYSNSVFCHYNKKSGDDTDKKDKTIDNTLKYLYVQSPLTVLNEVKMFSKEEVTKVQVSMSIIDNEHEKDCGDNVDYNGIMELEDGVHIDMSGNIPHKDNKEKEDKVLHCGIDDGNDQSSSIATVPIEKPIDNGTNDSPDEMLTQRKCESLPLIPMVDDLKLMLKRKLIEVDYDKKIHQ